MRTLETKPCISKQATRAHTAAFSNTLPSSGSAPASNATSDGFAEAFGGGRGSGDQHLLLASATAQPLTVSEGVFYPVLKSERFEARREIFSCTFAVGVLERPGQGRRFAAFGLCEWKERGDLVRRQNLLCMDVKLAPCLAAAAAQRDAKAADSDYLAHDASPAQQLTADGYSAAVTA